MRRAIVRAVGLFMQLTAVSASETDRVAGAIIGYAAGHLVDAVIDPGPPGTGERDLAQVVPAGDGWHVIFWPKYFAGLGPASQWLSAELETVVSAVEIYDGDLWNHLLFTPAGLIDRFSSFPDYFTRNRAQRSQLRRDWAGNPEAVGEVLGIPPARIAGYLRHPHSSILFGRAARNRRVHPQDGSELGDVWVFTDFWRHLGITYPDLGASDAHQVLVRFDGNGSQAMPSGGTDFSL